MTTHSRSLAAMALATLFSVMSLVTGAAAFAATRPFPAPPPCPIAPPHRPPPPQPEQARPPMTQRREPLRPSREKSCRRSSYTA